MLNDAIHPITYRGKRILATFVKNNSLGIAAGQISDPCLDAQRHLQIIIFKLLRDLCNIIKFHQQSYHENFFVEETYGCTVNFPYSFPDSSAEYSLSS